MYRCIAILGLAAHSLVAGSQWVRGSAGRIRVEQAGKGGIPLVFVHGNGACRGQWLEQVKRFSKERLVVTLDLRGLGESDPPADGTYGPEAGAGDLHAVVEALALPSFVLVGHSYGGAVVAAYAATHPERLAGLVFNDVAGDMRGTPADQAQAAKDALSPERYRATTRAWFEQILARAAESTRRRVLADLEATRPEAFRGCSLSLLRFDPAGAGSFKGPKLHLYTELLENNPLALHASVPGLEARLVPGTSHWPHLDRPDAFNAVLGEFLRGVEAGAQCQGPGSHDLDFLLGEWRVRNPEGTLLGTLSVQKEASGCAFLERFRPVQGPESTSFYALDAATGRWSCTWAQGGAVRAGSQARGGGPVWEGAGGTWVLRWERREEGRLRRIVELQGPDGMTRRQVWNCRREP
ncbi:MAG: alpha/beta hydrolase [Acidobacteria bacterium]|nr:alpha/beta hydrolase [Acidobacteriota bacterium]